MAFAQDSLDLTLGEGGVLERMGALTLRLLPVTAGVLDLYPPSLQPVPNAS